MQHAFHQKMSQLISDIRSRDQRTSFSNKRQSDGGWLGLGLGLGRSRPSRPFPWIHHCVMSSWLRLLMKWILFKLFRAVFTWLSKGIGFGFTTPFGWLVYLLWFWFYDSQVKTALPCDNVIMLYCISVSAALILMHLGEWTLCHVVAGLLRYTRLRPGLIDFRSDLTLVSILFCSFNSAF